MDITEEYRDACEQIADAVAGLPVPIALASLGAIVTAIMRYIPEAEREAEFVSFIGKLGAQLGFDLSDIRFETEH